MNDNPTQTHLNKTHTKTASVVILCGGGDLSAVCLFMFASDEKLRNECKKTRWRPETNA